MQKIKKYQKQIFTFVTIFLLLEFGIFPCLTMANTFANIVGGIGLLVMIIWAVFEIIDFINSPSVFEEENNIKPKRKPKTK